MFILMLRCGLRISEVANLQMADLSWRKPSRAWWCMAKARKNARCISRPRPKRALHSYLAERSAVKCEFVFLSYLQDGLSTTAIHKRLMRYRAQAGLVLSAHRLRHSFANDLLNADVPITSIQKLMGHRWIESTQTYVMANDQQVCADYYAACVKIEGWVASQDVRPRADHQSRGTV